MIQKIIVISIVLILKMEMIKKNKKNRRLNITIFDIIIINLTKKGIFL